MPEKADKEKINVTPSNTDRIETFSDSVFAIVITLLVLEIYRPTSAPGRLLQELLGNWPSYVAYFLAFFYAGIIWLNHHYLFQAIERNDLKITCTNLFWLGMVALLPYSTGVAADAFRLGNFANEKAAVVLYSIVGGLISFAWLLLFIHLARHSELLRADIRNGGFCKEVSRPVASLIAYIAAGLLGWYVHPYWAIAFFVFVIFFHAITCQSARRIYSKA